MNAQNYMNVKTGSVGTREDWDYENGMGEIVNAVDRGEVVPVILVDGEWVEGNES